MNKGQRIRAAYELGFDNERKYRGCAQSTVAAVQEALGIRNDFVFKAAGGLAAGCGLLCNGPCGGYSGGILAMSMFFARVREKFDDDREENYCSYRMAIELEKRYMEQYGSILCKDIHEKLFARTFDLWNKADKQQFEQAGAHIDKCTSVVANASAWATEIILNEIEKRSLTLGDFAHLIFHPIRSDHGEAAPRKSAV
jgi:C_GCAxxG_C_C family probable redox protein